MIIGLTGSMGCGKGEIVKILEKKDFKYITLSMMVREEARKRNIEEKRENLMDLGNAMRAKEGAGVLGKRALEKIRESGHDRWVVDGIRNPAEIDALKEGCNIHIIGVHSDEKILAERILLRARESDATNQEDILRKIEREWGKDEPPEGQQVGKCMEKADVIIDNDGDLKDLQEKFIKIYNSLNNV